MSIRVGREPKKTHPMNVKRAVYERAKGKCEKCGIPVEMSEGDFHHTRDPTVTPRAKSVRFLCPTCHRKYGHKRTIRKRETLLYSHPASTTLLQLEASWSQ